MTDLLTNQTCPLCDEQISGATRATHLMLCEGPKDMSDIDADLDELLGNGAQVVEKYRGENRDHDDLVQLMLDICPPNDKGVVSVPVLANRLGVTPQCIYNIIKRQRISYKRAMSILRLDPDSGYSIQDFEDYIM